MAMSAYVSNVQKEYVDPRIASRGPRVNDRSSGRAERRMSDGPVTDTNRSRATLRARDLYVAPDATKSAVPDPYTPKPVRSAAPAYAAPNVTEKVYRSTPMAKQPRISDPRRNRATTVQTKKQRAQPQSQVVRPRVGGRIGIKKAEVHDANIAQKTIAFWFSKIMLVQALSWYTLVLVILHAFFLFFFAMYSFAQQTVLEAASQGARSLVATAAVKVADKFAELFGIATPGDYLIAVAILCYLAAILFADIFLLFTLALAWSLGIHPLNTTKKQGHFVMALIFHWIPVIGMFPWGIFWLWDIRKVQEKE